MPKRNEMRKRETCPGCRSNNYNTEHKLQIGECEDCGFTEFELNPLSQTRREGERKAARKAADKFVGTYTPDFRIDEWIDKHYPVFPDAEQKKKDGVNG